jgi:hypothetical protein
MSHPRTLLRFHDLQVDVDSHPSDELVTHMQSTVLGQPGGFRYMHMDIEKKLKAPGENYFMYLRKSGRMIGSVGFVGRHTETAGIFHDSWMIRFFSIKAPMRSVPERRKRREDVKEENKRSSVLGRFIQPVYDDPSRLREGGDPGRPAIIFALIEQKNLRSMNFSVQMGMETVGEVSSFTFSRMRPRRSERIRTLKKNEQEEMLGLLRGFYGEYTLFFPDPLFMDDGYHVIREGADVVAGLQVYPVSWHVVDFGGGPSRLLAGLLVKIPWIRKRIDPDEIRLLAFDGIYCAEGREDALYELMEGVLERAGRYVGVLMMDKQSDLFRIFDRKKNLGILHRILGGYTAEMRMHFINLPEEVRQHFRDHPSYVPTYDNS